MKEDTNLVCSVAFDDPFDVWAKIQSDIIDRLPLENVQYKNPMTSAVTTIGKLPIRFMPSSKFTPSDAEHPFRWFLSAYCHIYFLQVETVDIYKATKSNIKQWVESHNTGNYGIKRSWIIVFVPSGKNTSEHYNKIFSKISQDFFVERPGDRTVQLNYAIIQTKSIQILDLLARVKELIISSFQQRCALYDSDLRKLESNRGTSNMEFQKLFITKESLGLMYQMMKLPHEALLIYEDLEQLVATYGSREMPAGDYPWTVSQIITSSTSGSAGGGGGANSETSNLNSTASTLSSAVNGSKDMDGWTSCCRNGDEILIYNMNDARIRFVKSKISYPELQKYTYSRQMYYLLEVLNNPIRALQKTIEFLNQFKANIDKRVFDINAVSSSKSPDPKASTMQRDPNTSVKFYKGGIISALISDAPISEEDATLIKLLQADIYLVVAAVKVARACKAIIDQHLVQTARQSGGGGSLPISTNPAEANLDGKQSFPAMTSPYLESGEQATTAILLVRELLGLAMAKLENLLPAIGLSKLFSNNISNFVGSVFSQTDVSSDETGNDILQNQYLTHSLARLGKASRCDYFLQAMQPDEILSSISQRLRHLAYFLSSAQTKKKNLSGEEEKKVSSLSSVVEVSRSPTSSSELTDLNSSSSLASPDANLKGVKSAFTPASQFSSTVSSHFNKVLQLESSIPILFMRSLAAIDDLSGRYRKSIFERLKCAILMMYYCNYASSAVVLSTVISALNYTKSIESFRAVSSVSININSLPHFGPGIPSLNTSHLHGCILSDVLYHILVRNNNKFSKDNSFTCYLRSNLSGFQNFAKVPLSCSTMKVHLLTSSQIGFKRAMKSPFPLLHESAYSRLNYEDFSCIWSSTWESILINIIYCSQNLKDAISFFILFITLLKCRRKLDLETFQWSLSSSPEAQKDIVDSFVVRAVSDKVKSPNQSDIIFDKLFNDLKILLKNSKESAAVATSATVADTIYLNNNNKGTSSSSLSSPPLPIQYFQFPLSDFFVADVCVPFESNSTGNPNIYFKQSNTSIMSKSKSTGPFNAAQGRSSDANLDSNNNSNSGIFASVFSCTVGDVNTLVLRLFSKLPVDLPIDKVLLHIQVADSFFNIDNTASSSNLEEGICLEGSKILLSKEHGYEKSSSDKNDYASSKSTINEEKPIINGRFQCLSGDASVGTVINPGGNIFEFTLPYNLIGDYVITTLSITMDSLIGSSPFVAINNTNSSVANDNSLSNTSSCSSRNPAVSSFQSKALVSFVNHFAKNYSGSYSIDNPIPIIRISEIVTKSSNIDALVHSDGESNDMHYNYSLNVSTQSAENSQILIKDNSIVPLVSNEISSKNSSKEDDITSNDIRKTISIGLFASPFMPVTRCSSCAIFKISLSPLMFRKRTSVIEKNNEASGTDESLVVIRELNIDFSIGGIINSSPVAMDQEELLNRSDIKFINPINSQWSCNIFFKSSSGSSSDESNLHKQVYSSRFSSCIDNEKIDVDKLPEHLENVTMTINDISVPQSLADSKVSVEMFVEIPIFTDKKEESDAENICSNLNIVSATARFLLNVGDKISSHRFIPVRGSSSVVIKRALSLLCQKKLFLSSIYKSASRHASNNLLSICNNIRLRYQVTNNSSTPIIIQGFAFVVPADMRGYATIVSTPMSLKNVGEINQNLTSESSIQSWLQKCLGCRVDASDRAPVGPTPSKTSQNLLLCPGRSYFIEIVVAVSESTKNNPKLDVYDIVKSVSMTWYYRLSIDLFNQFYGKLFPFHHKSQFSKVLDHIYSETVTNASTELVESFDGDNVQILEFNGSSRLHLSFKALAKLKLSGNIKSHASAANGPTSFTYLESMTNVSYFLYMKPMLIFMNDPDFSQHYRYSMDITVSLNLNSLVPVGPCKKRFLFYFEYSSSPTTTESSFSNSSMSAVTVNQANIITFSQHRDPNAIPERMMGVNDTNTVFEFPFDISLLPTAIGETLLPDLNVSYEVRPVSNESEADSERKFDIKVGKLNLKLEVYNNIKSDGCCSSIAVLPPQPPPQSLTVQRTNDKTGVGTSVIRTSFRAIKHS